ncbi:MFS transporter permease [Pseudohoeflea coraliihabitans]|uniref:MFS transporter permease n=1 Tax=Pseudohoeflea coraliihabitans TaxID=2860393 RepID=A0ABS6WSD2_9HYPH|nr:MFS transporter permease [Pseudohoeflea sp. DP4N28-3]MBW3098337.1 MFS transporter permease [Pseudohoeflea sp. DP4N28-3]
MTAPATLKRLFADDEMAQVCRDLPDSACREQPRNHRLQVLSLSLTKLGEGLADTKLVLAWLLDAIGAPTWAIGLLVPIRESLALLPQLLLSAHIRLMRIRKTAYIAGCIVQGCAIAAFGLVALTLSGATAGLAAIGLIAVFALGRSVCSISHKDVLAKTVDKGRRGSVSGIAGTVAAAGVLLLALGYASGLVPLTVPVVAMIVILGASLWLLAALVFAKIEEYPGATEGGINGLSAVFAQLRFLRRDAQLRRFILARSLLLSTALAPPFYIALSGDSQPGGLGTLGPFMMAAAAASLASSYVWGRFADRSSRRVLMMAAGLAAIANALAAVAALTPQGGVFAVLPLPVLLFVVLIAHQGVRLGRSVHIVDMADLDSRATYTALSNSVVGLVLLAGGSFGFLAQWFGIGTVLVIFALMAAMAVWVASRLDEVQSAD